MERRIAPSAPIEEDIEAVLLDGVADPDAWISELGRLATQLIIQRAVEDEVEAFLSRARYQRTPDAKGSRNGHRPRRIQTAEGEIVVAMPQVRDTLDRFRQQRHPRRPRASSVPDPWRRSSSAPTCGACPIATSSRLAREAGLGAISRTTCLTICRELRDRYRAFRARSLAEVRLLALFCDAIYLPVRPDGPKEGVLVAWGFTLSGERVLLDVALGQRERLEDWLELGRGLVARGLPDPLLVVADGAPGLVRAIGELWPGADRQRCTVHRLRNVLAKLPERPGLHERVRAAYWAALDTAADPAEAERGLRELVGSLEREYPSAAACLAEDVAALSIHLAYPLRLRKRLRSTNLLERSLGEVRRRTKVIGRFPGESSCLTLAWAVMDLVIASAKGLGLDRLERHTIAAIVARRSAPRTDELVA